MILECEALSYEYERNKKVLENLSINIEAGESVGLIGCNGVGKSTLLKLIVGLLTPVSGLIKVNGMEVNRRNLEQVRQQVGFVFQDADNQLFMPTVAEDIAFGPANYGIKGDELTQRVDSVLAELGIEGLKSRKTTRLSGGEKKLVSLATVLALKPDLLILDEPSIALDPGNRRRLIRVLSSLGEARLVATHDLDLVLDVCDRVILMSDSHIAADGRAEDILFNKELLESCGLELPLCAQRKEVYNGRA